MVRLRKRMIFYIACVCLGVSVLCWWVQMPSRVFIQHVLLFSDFDVAGSEKDDAVKEIQRSYCLSSLVLEVEVLNVLAEVKCTSDPSEGWIMTEVQPLDIYKGRYAGGSFFVRDLGNQKTSIDDGSVFSRNQSVRDGDQCLVFLRKDRHLSRVSKQQIFRCVKLVLCKAQTKQRVSAGRIEVRH